MYVCITFSFIEFQNKQVALPHPVERSRRIYVKEEIRFRLLQKLMLLAVTELRISIEIKGRETTKE
jgi:hypothetical protein